MQPNSQSRVHAARVQTVECPPSVMGDVHIYIAFIVVLIGALYVLNHGQRNVSGITGLINARIVYDGESRMWQSRIHK